MVLGNNKLFISYLFNKDEVKKEKKNPTTSAMQANSDWFFV